MARRARDFPRILAAAAAGPRVVRSPPRRRAVHAHGNSAYRGPLVVVAQCEQLEQRIRQLSMESAIASGAAPAPAPALPAPPAAPPGLVYYGALAYPAGTAIPSAAVYAPPPPAPAPAAALYGSVLAPATPGPHAASGGGPAGPLAPAVAVEAHSGGSSPADGATLVRASARSGPAEPTFRSPIYRPLAKASPDVRVSNFSRAPRFRDEKTWVPGTFLRIPARGRSRAPPPERGHGLLQCSSPTHVHSLPFSLTLGVQAPVVTSASAPTSSPWS